MSVLKAALSTAKLSDLMVQNDEKNGRFSLSHLQRLKGLHAGQDGRKSRLSTFLKSRNLNFNRRFGPNLHLAY